MDDRSGRGTRGTSAPPASLSCSSEELEGLERHNGRFVGILQDTAQVGDERGSRVGPRALVVKRGLGQANDDLLVLGITDSLDTLGVLQIIRLGKLQKEAISSSGFI